jgi:hypothetical protein
MVDKIQLRSPDYRVVRVYRKSKARYNEGVVVGDVVSYRTVLGDTSKGRGGVIMC